MSEAEYRTNSAFSNQTNYIKSTELERASQLFIDSFERYITNNATTSYTFVNLLESQTENLESVKLETSYIREEIAEHNVGALSNTGTPLYALSELAKLLALIHQMRTSNSNLNQQVMQLEQALTECQSALQSQEQRSHHYQTTLTQTTQELAAAQAQVKYLSEKLAIAEQNTQRQQTQIDTVTAQCQKSQEQIAQMERECAQTQANYNERSHQLWQTESDCRELRTRLARQQRQTLQLKVALEKCIEAPVSSHQTEYSIQADFSLATSDSILSPDSLLPKAQPISPWTAQPQFHNDELEIGWTKFSGSPFTSETSSFNWSTEDFNAYQQEDEANSRKAPATVSQSVGQTREAQHDAVIDLLIDPSPSLRTVELPKITTDLVETDLVETYSSTENSPEAEDAEWQDFVNHLFETLEEPVTNHAAENNLNQFQFTESPQQGINSSTTDSSWPSPVVYPCHPAKKRKSLAAIELPKFSQAKGTRE